MAQFESTGERRPADGAAAPAALAVRGLAKRYGGLAAVEDVAFELSPGELFALLGPSGCGKTTVLRSIAGIVEPDAGAILLNGEDISRKPIYARDTALVFQNYALFPHLTVEDNIAFGLRMRGLRRKEVRRRVAEALELVQLPGLARRLPSQLSGGQQQRVALARALVVRPALLLLDEPLSNLDARLREEMRIEIRRLQRSLGLSTIMVTHDISEAFAAADRIAVMRQGRIEQIGAPAEIYGAPASRFVAEFVGYANLFDAVLRDAAAGVARLELAGGFPVTVALRGGPGSGEWRVGAAAWLVIPPERIRIGPAATGLANRHVAQVEEAVYLGSLSQYRLRLGPLLLVAQAQNTSAPSLGVGDKIAIGWGSDDCIARPLG
jgi:ABC-type Fe3+/spermidine/putrescine transport system ATPase subunit